MTDMSRSQSKAEYGRFAHLFVGGIEWLLSQWQELTGGEETDLHSHAASGGASGPVWSDPVMITDTQMLALDTAHVDLVPAPTDPNELLLPLLVFIKQYGTDSGYNDQPNTTHLTIGWGGVSANESGAGTVVAQPIATVLAAAERHTIIPVGTGFAGITGQVGEVAAAITPGPGLAISLGADDVMAGTADPTRSLVVWTLYQRITLPS